MNNLTVLLATVLLVATAGVTQARDLDQDEALRLRQQGVIQPLEELLQPAYDRYPGARLLEAELEAEHGQYVYEIELLTAEGQVRELELDARDGRLLHDKEDN